MMLHLIDIEWAKFKKHRSFRTLLLLYLVFLPALLLLPRSLPGLEAQLGDLSSFYMFPNIFKYGGYLSSWLIYLIAGFLGVTIITTDIQNKTLRQNIITGLSRGQFFLGKIGFAFSLALFFVLYFCLCALVLGVLNTDTIYFSKLLEGLPIVFGLFLQALAYLSVGILMGLWLKRTGLALFLFFTYPLIEIFLRYGLHNRIIGSTGIKYYPFNVFEDLVPIPFAKTINSMAEDLDFDLLLVQNTAVVATIVYLVLILGLIYFKLKKSDL